MRDYNQRLSTCRSPRSAVEWLSLSGSMNAVASSHKNRCIFPDRRVGDRDTLAFSAKKLLRGLATRKGFQIHLQDLSANSSQCAAASARSTSASVAPSRPTSVPQGIVRSKGGGVLKVCGAYGTNELIVVYRARQFPRCRIALITIPEIEQ